METTTLRFKHLEKALSKGTNKRVNYSFNRRHKLTQIQHAAALKEIFLKHADDIDITDAIASLDEIINKEENRYE